MLKDLFVSSPWREKRSRIAVHPNKLVIKRRQQEACMDEQGDLD